MGDTAKPDPITGGILTVADNTALGEGEWLYSKNGQYRMGVLGERLVVQNFDIDDHDKFDVYSEWQSNVLVSDRAPGAVSLLFRVPSGVRRRSASGLRPLVSRNQYMENNSITQIALTNDGRVVPIKEGHELGSGWDGEYPGDEAVFDHDVGLKSIEELTFGEDYESRDVENVEAGNAPDGYPRDYPLKILTPLGASESLALSIEFANSQLRYLALQIGTGEITAPSFLLDPDNDFSGNDNLTDDFVRRMGDLSQGKPPAASGRVVPWWEISLGVSRAFDLDPDTPQGAAARE